MKKILITYYSKWGSTREAAEIIGNTLEKSTFEVEILPLAEVRTVQEFDMVIIGAPINGMQWFHSATAFVLAHRDELRQKKTALFCMSYIYFTGSGFWKKAIEKAFAPVLKVITPIKTGIFGGKIDASLPPPMRFIFGIPADAPLSIFNREDIQKWASDLLRAELIRAEL